MDVDYLNIDQRLIDAVERNDVAGLAVILAAEPPSASFALTKDQALHDACQWWSDWTVGCARLLLAAGADPNSSHSRHGDGTERAVHVAARTHSTACLAALLAAGADALALDRSGRTACHLARDAATVRLLLAAAPQAALMRDVTGCTPAESAIKSSHFGAAQCLLAEALLQPVPELVSLLRSRIEWRDAHLNGPNEPYRPSNQDQLSGLLQLMPILVARLDLAPSDFTQHARHHSLMVSSELGRWLPAMMKCSEAAAARLMAFLPADDRCWLRTLALSLGRWDRRLSARLPPPILRRLLVLAAEGHAQHVAQRLHQKQRCAQTAENLLVIFLAISFWALVIKVARTYWPPGQ